MTDMMRSVIDEQKPVPLNRLSADWIGTSEMPIGSEKLVPPTTGRTLG